MPRTAPVLACLFLLSVAGHARAGEPAWREVTSAHFTVIANVGEREMRAVAWRFEQARSAVAATCPWAKVDLAKPVVVIAVQDEASMRALVPEYWEEKKAVHPDGVWLQTPERYYIVLRADLRDEGETAFLPHNPYQTAYFAYMHVLISSSFPVALPPWFSRGFSAVLSNTVIGKDAVLVGAPMVPHLRRLRDHPPLRLAKLMKTAVDAPELRQEESLLQFDSSAWAFVHFLLFADSGIHRGQIDGLTRLLQRGTPAAAAVEQALEPIEKFDDDYRRYVGRSIFQYQRSEFDLTVKREAFPVRNLSPGQVQAARAAFFAATGRTTEARVAIAESQRLEPDAAPAYEAEALLLDVSGQQAAARATYEKAIARHSISPYVYYRCAMLSWPENASREQLGAIEKWLSEAVRLNNRFAAAYAGLGHVRASLTGAADRSVPLALRAIALEPGVSGHHWSAAATYLMLGQYDQAQVEAQTAAILAATADERRAAADLLASIETARADASAREIQARQNAEASRQASDTQAKVAACTSGDPAACASLAPWLEGRCGERDGGACGMLGWLRENGRGVDADPSQAARYYRLACDAGEKRGCVGFAMLQARGAGIPKDEAAALVSLETACAEQTAQACTQLAVVLASRQRAADRPRIRSLLDAICTGGDTRACEMLASMPAR